MYYERVFREMGQFQTDLEVAMKTQHFHPSEHMAIIELLQTFK